MHRASTIVILFLTTSITCATEISRERLAVGFQQRVRPFINAYCADCHGDTDPEAGLDLTRLKSLSDARESHQLLKIVADRLGSEEMPPNDAASQPAPAIRQAAIDWIHSFRDFEAKQNAGDPGPVLVRRLSNSEYNYSIRDLTGVHIEPAKTFPIDPANEAGFDNSAESLRMSPSLLRKYLAAAKNVADHLVLTPEGLTFAPHHAVTNTDRDKYCVKRIVDFYYRQPIDYTDYFLASWRYKHREKSSVNIEDFAEIQRLSGKYLKLVYDLLTESETWGQAGPILRLRDMWNALPSERSKVEEVRVGCQQMNEYVQRLREQLVPHVSNLKARGIHKGSQCFVLWKNKQKAKNRRTYDSQKFELMRTDKAYPELARSEDESEERIMAMAMERFCSIFPDAFYISERGRDYLDKPREQQEKGRLLSAGFHSMMGYFRDDGPLYDLILNAHEQQELDALWRELDFIAFAPIRQYVGFLWFERTDSRYMRDPQFDFARAEDKNANSEEMIRRLADVYSEKAKRIGAGNVELQAVAEFFEDINQQIRWVERARVAAIPQHLDALLALAAKAFRRPLTNTEQDDIRAFYHRLRDVDGLEHEVAIRDSLVSILMSPHFCYRLDLAVVGEELRPLSATELASRLSYFLWSSLPDRRLLEKAESAALLSRSELIVETNRMLGDDRIEALATEFGANWLDFRRFQQHNSVDRERFPTFTDELRQAMFEEPIRFLVDLLQNDRSILECLHGDHTFVNLELARHYGFSTAGLETNQWARRDGLAEFGRGGLLPMSVFLTNNSPGLRTSPVKRGYWIVRRLLGEHIPSPPPNVPELPNDEADFRDVSLRELLAKHREHKSCAVCHDRFDAIGLAFEGYGPIGELRHQDIGGRPVDTAVTLPGGVKANGIEDLREYLKSHREQEFVDNLCRKLLSYALGRSLQLSDEPLIEELKKELARNDHRIGGLITRIVVSPQFLKKRGREPNSPNER